MLHQRPPGLAQLRLPPSLPPSFPLIPDLKLEPDSLNTSPKAHTACPACPFALLPRVKSRWGNGAFPAPTGVSRHLGCCSSHSAEAPLDLRPGRIVASPNTTYSLHSGSDPNSRTCSHWSNNPHRSSYASKFQAITDLNWKHLRGPNLPEEAQNAQDLNRTRDRGKSGQNSCSLLLLLGTHTLWTDSLPTPDLSCELCREIRNVSLSFPL